MSGGELFAGRPDGRAELLVSAADLERILGRPAALEQVAWVDDERFWAVVRTGETATVALMTADGLVGSPWFGAPSVSRLRLSSSGMAAVSSDRGVVFFDSGRRPRADLHERARRDVGSGRRHRRRLDAA